MTDEQKNTEVEGQVVKFKGPAAEVEGQRKKFHRGEGEPPAEDEKGDESRDADDGPEVEGQRKKFHSPSA